MYLCKISLSRLLENRLLVFKPYALVLRNRWIPFGLSSVVQSKDHCLQVVAVNVFLHNRVSGRPQFSLVEISVTLDIGLKLKQIVICVFHYRKWSIRIRLQSQLFEKPHFIGFM